MHPGISIWLGSLAPGGQSAGHAGGTVGEAGLRSQSRKIFRGAQRCGEQQTLAKYPSTCKACALHRMRAFHTQDTKQVWKAVGPTYWHCLSQNLGAAGPDPLRI